MGDVFKGKNNWVRRKTDITRTSLYEAPILVLTGTRHGYGHGMITRN